MRILIDESLPVELTDEVAGHDVTTVRSQRWIGLKNGVLLRAATRAGVGVLVTADRSLPHQQNLRRLGIAVIIVAGIRNRIEDVRPLIPQILDAIATIKPGESVRIARTPSDSIRDQPPARATMIAPPT